MSTKSLNLSQKNKLGILAVILLLFLVLPIFSMATSRTKIYVDASVSTSGDGSSSRPYKTIKEALKKANKKNQVFIRKGTYKENIEIPEGVQVVGVDRDDVKIEATNKNNSVVLMNNKSELVKVTVRKGKNGVKVNPGDRASINKCIIRDNDKDGVVIQDGKVNKDDRVVITNSTIKDNGRAGIFANKRKVVLMDNEIYGNDGDGVNLDDSMFAWVKDNEIRNNSKTGLTAKLDGSDIFIVSNKIKNNRKDGIQVETFGKSGNMEIQKNKITGNGGSAIVRIQRGNFPKTAWAGLKIFANNVYANNGKIAVPPVISAF